MRSLFYQMMNLIVDSHEDLAWNIQVFQRDYTRAAAETRRLEQGSDAVAYNDDTMLGWPDYQRGRVAIVFSTLFVTPAQRKEPWESLFYTDYNQARKHYLEQMTVYRRLTDDASDKFRLVTSRKDLEGVLGHWQRPLREGEDGHPVGLVPLMESAEAIREPAELEEWWQLGLRHIGLAWGATRFCGGTKEPGPLTSDGRVLLEAMADYGFTLDVSHMDRQAALKALDSYPGPAIASHSNTLAMLKGSESNRHLPDDVIRAMIERGGVIGVVPYNTFLQVGWMKQDGREQVTLERLVDHIEHICQMAGSSDHVGIGSDFDGGFGWQSAPAELDTVADLQKLAPLLQARGYSETDIAAILGQNWINHLRKSLPES